MSNVEFSDVFILLCLHSTQYATGSMEFWPQKEIFSGTQRQPILSKIIKIVVINCQILRLNAPDSISAMALPPTPLGERTVKRNYISYLCRWSRRTVQQVQRCGVKSSCKSSKWHELRLQVYRCYGRLLLETLTVHGWTSCRMPIRLAISWNIIISL